MKKLILSKFCLAILYLVSGLLQPTRAQESFKIGFIAGLNHANASLTGTSTKAIPGYVLGSFVEIHLANAPFSIQTGISFSKNGAKFEDSITVFKRIFDYLELPLLVNLGLEMNKFRPRIYAGPVISYISKVQRKEKDKITSFTDTRSFTSFIHSLDFVLEFGVGVDYKLDDDNSVFLTVGYGMGMRDLHNDRFRSPPLRGTTKWKSKSVRILAGAKFPLD